MPPVSDEETNQKSGIAYGAAVMLFSSVLALLLAGWFVDRLLGTQPWCLVAGIILGAAVGFYQFIRITSRLS